MLNKLRIIYPGQRYIYGEGCLIEIQHVTVVVVVLCCTLCATAKCEQVEDNPEGAAAWSKLTNEFLEQHKKCAQRVLN